MISEIIEQLNLLCNSVPAKFRHLTEEQLTFKPNPAKWSKKELLGHLIDSAANNHQRFVRARIEVNPILFYDQDNWVDIQKYQDSNSENLINLWEMYNRHLVHIIGYIPSEMLLRTSRGKDGKSNTLEFLIIDYLNHLEHHLRSIF
jgi:hypothetical protein